MMCDDDDDDDVDEYEDDDDDDDDDDVDDVDDDEDYFNLVCSPIYKYMISLKFVTLLKKIR